MKKSVIVSGIVVIAFFSWLSTLHAQPMGPGMMRGYGSMGASQVSIPDKLPKPQNQEWVDKLRQILVLERLSQAQYESDRAKYQVNMPYTMILPQEGDHIGWITRLFAAYVLPSDGKTPPTKQSDTLAQAYEIGRQLEEGLIPQYEWLIRNAPDNTASQVLDTILLETRMHYTMFDHALRMGGMRGSGMGMGPR